MLLPILLLLIPAALGSGLVAAFRATSEKLTVVLLGTTLGIVSTTTAFYAIEWLWRLPVSLIGALLGLEALLAVWLIWSHWSWFKQCTLDRVGLIVFGAIGVMTLIIAPKLLFIEDDTLVTGILNAWGDLGWHVANITLFAEGQPVPPENPILAGESLRYPFLINYLSGLIVRLGGSLVFSVVAPAVVFIPIIFSLLYRTTKALTRDSRAGVLAVLLMFLSGSTLGWLMLRDDLSTTTWPIVEFFFHLPQDYSGNGGNEHGFHFVNVLLAGLLPQRSFLLGLALAGTIVVLTLEYLKQRRPHLLLVAGVVAGLVPLAHAHTTLAVIPTLVGLCLVHLFTEPDKHKRKAALRHWGIFAGAALLVGLPGVLYYVLGTPPNEGSFLRYEPGWTLSTLTLPWYTFWLHNTGLLIPLTLLGLLLPVSRNTKIVAASGLLLFTAAHLFLFAPWPWDNYKLMVYWLFFTAPLLGAVFSKGLSSKKVWVVTLALLLFGFHIQTGALDITRTSLASIPRWPEWDSEAQQFATILQQQVPVGSTIATAPYHNSPAALVGRPVYLGFPGHIWSHGVDAGSRQRALSHLYAGSLTTLPEADVAYAVVGPIERQHYTNLVIQDSWQPLGGTENYQLYKIK